jgi:hypothetical protein
VASGRWASGALNYYTTRRYRVTVLTVSKHDLAMPLPQKCSARSRIDLGPGQYRNAVASGRWASGALNYYTSRRYRVTVLTVSKHDLAMPLPQFLVVAANFNHKT